jgi:TPR repeat protein
MYLDGEGTAQNKEVGMHLMHRAAAAEISDAFLPLANFYLEKSLEDPSFVAKAKKFLKKAARLGSAEAACKLGKLFEGLIEYTDPANITFNFPLLQAPKEINHKKAYHYYKMAALLNYPPAQYALALMHHKEPTLQNIKKAGYWAKKSALARYKPAMLLLSELYEKSPGPKRNLKEATKWRLAADATSDDEWKF